MLRKLRCTRSFGMSFFFSHGARVDSAFRRCDGLQLVAAHPLQKQAQENT